MFHCNNSLKIKYEYQCCRNGVSRSTRNNTRGQPGWTTSFEVLIKNDITHRTCFKLFCGFVPNKKLTVNFFWADFSGRDVFHTNGFNYSHELNIN